MIDKYFKYAPYLIGGGLLVALGLLLTGNHMTYYESSTMCNTASCPAERARVSLPFVFAILAIVDGIVLLIVKRVRKNTPSTDAPDAQQTSYDPNTGGFNTPTSGHYDPNNQSAYDPNTPNK